MAPAFGSPPRGGPPLLPDVHRSLDNAPLEPRVETPLKRSRAQVLADCICAVTDRKRTARLVLWRNKAFDKGNPLLAVEVPMRTR